MKSILKNSNGNAISVNGKLLIGNTGLEEFDSKIYYRQTRPKDWLKVNLPSEMEELYPDQDRIELLFEIQEDDNVLPFLISGVGTIDWGDGTTDTFNGNLVAFNKRYSNDIGVKQVLVVITAEKNKITEFDFKKQKEVINEDGYEDNSWQITHLIEISINAKSCVLQSIYAGVSNFVKHLREVVYFSLDCILADTGSFFTGMHLLKVFPEFTTRNNNHTQFNFWFSECHNLHILPIIDFSKANYINRMCNNCYELITVFDIYAPNITSIAYLFYDCKKLKNFGELTFGELTNAEYAFYYCENMKDFPLKNTSTITNMKNIVNYCSTLKKLTIDCTSATDVSYLGAYCLKLEELIITNTENVSSAPSFANNMSNIKKVGELDMRNITSTSNWFSDSYGIKEVKLKNIKVSLSCFSSPPMLTKATLIGLIKELVDIGSTLKLTLGSTKLSRLSDIYVKLTGAPEEVEGLIKLPCEVCNADDEGAMSIIAYANSKNWTLA